MRKNQRAKMRKKKYFKELCEMTKKRLEDAIKEIYISNSNIYFSISSFISSDYVCAHTNSNNNVEKNIIDILTNTHFNSYDIEPHST